MARRRLQDTAASALCWQSRSRSQQSATRLAAVAAGGTRCQSRTHCSKPLRRPESHACVEKARRTRDPQRCYASTSRPEKLAVIGGGATGLTAAYYLAKHKPNAKITIYEASNRLGGWIRTERMPVSVNGVEKEIMFEFGPRGTPWPLSNCWRFDDLVLWDLLEDFGMLRMVTGKGMISRGVFHNGEFRDLNNITPYQGLLEPNGLFKGLAPSLLGLKLSQMRGRHKHPPPDMSVADWLRHIGCAKPVIDTLVSAFLHGVHGGDPDKLSARLVLDWIYWSYYHPEGWTKIQVPPSELDILDRLGTRAKPHHLQSIRHLPRGRMSLLHFGPNGMSTLTDALEFALKSPNVTFELNQPVQQLLRRPDDERIYVKTQQHESNKGVSESFDSVICAIAPDKVAQISEVELPTLAEIRSTSMWTVGLFYPNKWFAKTENAIGYTIPRSCPPSRNPYRALGVFFDHNAGNISPDEPPGTKLFVLMGGHYYDSGAVPVPSSPEEAIRQAMETVANQLGVSLETEVVAVANYAKNCIPQLEVGHTERLNKAHEAIQHHYGDGLVLAGGAYHRPGVLGALRSGWDAAAEVLGWNSYNHGAAVTRWENPVVIDAGIVPRPGLVIANAVKSPYLRYLKWGGF